MKFTPKTEQELQSMSQFELFEPGQYAFQVLTAEDQVSKQKYDEAGSPLPRNEMIKLKLKVIHPSGKEKHIFDYVLEAMAFKLRHFCEAVGLSEKYESGELKAFDCPGRTGKLDLTFEAGKQKPEGGYYPDKNSVKDYLKAAEGDSNPPEDQFSDQLPF